MKVLVIGAGGTVGKAIVTELAQRHGVIEVGKSRGAHRVDVLDPASIRALLAEVGRVYAVG